MADSAADDDSNPGSPGEAAFMGVVLVVMFLCLFFGIRTPETVVFICLVLVWNVGMVNTTEALSGFSNAGMLAVGALFVVIKGVEKSQLADKAARRVFGLQTSLASGLARLMLLCFVLSAFLNNTPVVALLIPITRDWARARGFSPSIFLIPLSYSCIMGGLLTVIGTSTNLVVQGLVLEEARIDSSIEAVGFFEPAYIGLPLGFIGMFYLVIFAPRLLPSRGGLFRYVRDRAKELLTEVQVMKDFPYIAEPCGLVLSRLGLPQDTLIKIRRKISSGILRQMSNCMEENLAMKLPAGVASIGSSASIIEANQKTFKAESMYSYRIRAESLWGKKGDLEEKAEAVPAGQTPSRKRWASDADANGVSAGMESSHGMATVRESKTDCTDLNPTGTYTDIYPVSAAEPVQADDVLFLSCAQATMIDFQAITVSQKLKGLKFLDVNALDLPGHGTEFFEVVLSGHNHFVGRSPGRDNSEFAAYYQCSVVAVRRRGSTDATSILPPAIGRSISNISAAQLSSREMVFDAAEVQLEEGLSSEPAFDSNTDSPSPTGQGANAADEASATLTRRTTSVARPPDEVSVPRSPVHENPGSSPNTARSGVSTNGGGRPLYPGYGLRSIRAKSTVTEEVTGIEVAQRNFKTGDVILVLAGEEFMEKFASSRDFFLLTKVGSVPKPVRLFDYLPLLAFLAMLIVVLLDVEMVQAAFSAGALLILGGWVDAKKTVGYIDWGLLLLIGSALGLSKGIVNSGLANYVGGAIRDSGVSAEVSVFILYLFTVMCTELITNNAAAALATPIAFSIARELEVSYKPLVLTVMIAASSSFITPIGYQTNTLVWGPGGYKFTDFMKIGTPLSLVYLVLGSFLIPLVFPF